MGRVKTPQMYLKMACDIAGGPSNLARQIGVSKQFMNSMIHRDYKIPIKRALLIAKAVDYKINIKQLRPDMADIL